ncbi:transporter family protein [Crocinitomix catalasitica]|uniref:hypothetical protein n=1 Tax=Crocinitomix catalasitica TaxID=184607 RepID=UPI00047F203F|nr:hypothetical protein [Crocinitomix catalasitica]
MKQFILVAFLALTTNFASACDVCGCSMNAFSMGLMQNQNTPYIGLRYSFAQFHASINHNTTNEGYEYSNDTYQRIDAVGRINLSENFKLNFQVPFLINIMEGSHQTVTTSGIGDPTIILTYHPFKGNIKWENHSIVLGAGVKAPLGKFDQEDNGELINPNFQMGTGSIDFLVNANYTYRKKSFGYNVEAAYKMNTKNRSNYRYGNQFNGALNGFYMLERIKTTTLFYTGGYFERAAVNLENNKNVFNTGGFGLFGNLGAQVYIKKFRVGVLCQLPIYQKFKTDQLTTINSKPRFTLDLIYTLGKDK